MNPDDTLERAAVICEDMYDRQRPDVRPHWLHAAAELRAGAPGIDPVVVAANIDTLARAHPYVRVQPIAFAMWLAAHHRDRAYQPHRTTLGALPTATGTVNTSSGAPGPVDSYQYCDEPGGLFPDTCQTAYLPSVTMPDMQTGAYDRLRAAGLTTEQVLTALGDITAPVPTPWHRGPGTTGPGRGH